MTLMLEFFARRGRQVALFTAILVAVAFLSAPAGATMRHLALKKSEPAKNDTITSLPADVKLWFTAKPDLRYTRLTLVGPVGEVTLGKATMADAAGSPVVFPVQGGGQAGTYTAKWVAASNDGHPMKGEFTFLIK